MFDEEKENYWSLVHDAGINLFSDYNLVQYNAIYKLVGNEVIYLFHATTPEKYIEIKNSKVMKTSGGCLAGGIYCTPIEVEKNDELRLHNLGGYYFFKEIPKVEYIRTEKKEAAKGLIFEISNHEHKVKMLGINYMKFGKIFYCQYKQLGKKIKQKYESVINTNVKRIVEKSKTFLLVTMEMYQRDISYAEAKTYMDLFNKAAEDLTLLGYVLFETISQYLVYNSTDDMVIKYKNKNEIYNWHYKDMIFSVFPSLNKRFNLEDIRYDEKSFCDYIIQNKIIENFAPTEFAISICRGCIEVLIQESIGFLEEKDFGYSLENNYKLQPLVGHVLHRILKNRDFRELYNQIEKMMACEVWEFWNKHEILIVYNSEMVKGEMGINPAMIGAFDYKIYECESIENRNGFFYIKKGNELDIKIQQELIEYNDSTLR